MIEIIKDGSLERLLVVVFLFGGIVVLNAMQVSFDERIYDLAFLVGGFYFGVTMRMAAQKATQSRETRSSSSETQQNG